MGLQIIGVPGLGEITPGTDLGSLISDACTSLAWPDMSRDRVSMSAMASPEAASLPVWNWAPRDALVMSPESALVAEATALATSSDWRPSVSRLVSAWR